MKNPKTLNIDRRVTETHFYFFLQHSISFSSSKHAISIPTLSQIIQNKDSEIPFAGEADTVVNSSGKWKARAVKCRATHAKWEKLGHCRRSTRLSY